MTSATAANTIGATVGAILAAPAPVLAVDTCSVLDLVRNLYRFEAPARLVEHALAAIGASIRVPPRLHILLFDQVHTELQRHISPIRQELGREMPKLSATGECVLPKLHARYWTRGAKGIEDFLSALPDAWMRASRHISPDAGCEARADNRLRNGEAPGRRGSKNVADCRVAEHLLESAAQLRTAGFKQAILFVSSNKKDYGGLSPKPPLDNQFSRDSIDFHPHIEAAVAQLGF
jgi:hypothetical protein